MFPFSVASVPRSVKTVSMMMCIGLILEKWTSDDLKVSTPCIGASVLHCSSPCEVNATSLEDSTIVESCGNVEYDVEPHGRLDGDGCFGASEVGGDGNQSNL